MPNISLTLSIDQAKAVRAALDLYTRLCLGQLERVADLVRDDVIPIMANQAGERLSADEHICAAVSGVLRDAKSHLNYPAVGSMGITHPHVHLSGQRAYVVDRALSDALARAADPDAGGLGSEALDLGFTIDPLPRVQLVEADVSQ